MKTLVDCGCVARVHSDGSGVEIDYCPQHEAAPEMYEALRSIRDHIDHNPLFAPGRDGELRSMWISNGDLRRMLAALAKADGKVAP